MKLQAKYLLMCSILKSLKEQHFDKKNVIQTFVKLSWSLKRNETI